VKPLSRSCVVSRTGAQVLKKRHGIQVQHDLVAVVWSNVVQEGGLLGLPVMDSEVVAHWKCFEMRQCTRSFVRKIRMEMCIVVEVEIEWQVGNTALHCTA
jgi:hypothetical protein